MAPRGGWLPARPNEACDCETNNNHQPECSLQYQSSHPLMTTTHPAEPGKANIQCTQNRTAYSIYSFAFFNMPYYAPVLLYTAPI